MMPFKSIVSVVVLVTAPTPASVASMVPLRSSMLEALNVPLRMTPSASSNAPELVEKPPKSRLPPVRVTPPVALNTFPAPSDSVPALIVVPPV